MRRAVQLALFLVCVSSASGQELTSSPELTHIAVSDQSATEVRIELLTTGPVDSPEVVGTYRDSLVLELPGTVYRALPRRIRVNRAGIRAVRVWMQSEHPASTRIVVEIDREEQYALASDGKTLVLRVGPALAAAPGSEVYSTAEVFGSRTPAVPGRGGASTSVASALSGIFHRSANKPLIYKGPPLRTSEDSGNTRSAANAAGTAAGAAERLPMSAKPEPPTVANLNAAAPQMSESALVTPTLSADNPPATLTGPNPTAKDVGTAQPSAPIIASLAREPSVIPDSKLPTLEAGSAAPETAPPVAAVPAPAASPEHVSDSAATPATGVSTPAIGIRAAPPVANPGVRTEFRVKFVEGDSAYIDGGRSSALVEGMKLLVRNVPGSGGSASSDASDPVAELVVIGLAETSAVTEIRKPQRDVVAGDVAFLSSESLEALVQQQAVSATRSYPAVITFSEDGDALDQEAHAFVPKPPLPSVNHAVARFGFDYIQTKTTDASQLTSSSYGAVLRVDYTRIAGTYWDLRGYWRGNFTSNSVPAQQTLQDLLNRTYHLALTYENPNSTWVMGGGRMYLPWAVSLETIDGGYFGARLGHGTTLGVFGGSTPDPTSWNYNPGRHLGGTFLNAAGGSFDGFRYSSTVGAGEEFQNVQYSTTSLSGTLSSSYADNRPFAFLENSISYGRKFSIFEALQADRPSSNPVVVSPGTGLSSSFLTLRVEPVSRVELTANDTYFRDIPTFDPQLIGTGLLDKYLFQGWSGGGRIEPIKTIFLYTELGRSNRTGDTSASLNQLYGITLGKLPKLKLRADAHYSKFSSSFGSGIYRAFSLSRSLGDRFHFEALGGDQAFTSTIAGNQGARFFTTIIDTSLGASFFLQGGFTMFRGQLQNYNQSYAIIGYQFDSKRMHK